VVFADLRMTSQGDIALPRSRVSGVPGASGRLTHQMTALPFRRILGWRLVRAAYL
jgi:hypothetical protein